MRVLRLFTVVFAFALAFGVACTGTTGNRRFELRAQASGGTKAFVNAKGWSVSLDKMNVTMGPIYLNTIAPLRTTSLDTWLRPKSAHAIEEEHLGDGLIVGQVLGQVTFDALSSAFVPFNAVGEIQETQIRTIEIAYYPPAGIAIDTLKIDSPTVDLAGSATLGTNVVRFRGQLILNDEWLPNATANTPGQTILTERLVRGIPAAFVPHPGGTLQIRFHPERLLDGADFSSLDGSPTDPDGTKILVQSKSGKFTTDQVMRNIFQGIKAAATYDVTWDVI